MLSHSSGFPPPQADWTEATPSHPENLVLVSKYIIQDDVEHCANSSNQILNFVKNNYSVPKQIFQLKVALFVKTMLKPVPFGLFRANNFCLACGSTLRVDI